MLIAVQYLVCNYTDGGIIFINRGFQTVYNEDNENKVIRSSPVIK